MANTSRNSIDGQNGQTARNTPLLQPVRGQQYQIAGVAPLGTNDYFGPAQPFLPMGPPGARGRVFDYPIAENIRIEPRDDEPLSFWDLIALAENHDVTRLCIETRKDQMESLQFNIRPKGSTGKKGKDKDQQYRIDKTEDFFKVPDGKHPFETWQREIMEQCLVIDATTIYIDKTRPKNTRLTVMDGAMIKRLIDENGQSPEHPWPAYQQFVKGMPSWDYTDKEIYYAPRNRRVHKLYGMSVVQQIYLCVNVALRRETSVLQYFTDGNIPDALMGVPETWTAQQIRDAQLAFDSLNSGNYAQRRRMRFIPGGSKYYPTREINLKTEFDEWLARIVCFAFNIPPTPFIKQSSRASASTMQEVAISEGLMPLMRWFTMMMNYMIQADHILAQSDLEFAYVEREESDPAARDKIWDAKIRRGQATVNEARAAEGDDPIPGGDTAMIYMGQGPIPLEMAANQAKMQLPSPGGGAAPGAPGGGSPAVKPPAARPASPAAGQPPNPGMKPITPPAAKPASNGRPTTTGKPLQRPTTKAEEVDESSRSPFSIEKVGQPRSQIVAEAEVNIQNTFSQAFENLSASASSYIEEAANHPDIGKADEEDQDAEKPLSPEEKAAMAAALDAVDSLSLEELIVTIDPTSEALEAIAEDGAEESIASIAVEPPSGILADANPRVIAWAKERAAELVGKKVLPSGEIIDNPDAEKAIDEPTRVMLRQTITESFQSGKGIQGLAKEIENSYAFSHERAMLIARTETINAFNSGAFIGYQEMAKQGVDLEKKWVDHPGACPVCIANAAAGYIGLNEPFPSGHQHPTAHPKCRCTFVAIARRDDDKV